MRSESGDLLVAESIKQAANAWKIPIEVLRLAREMGCDAFVAHRVHREKLVAWLAENEDEIAEQSAKTARLIANTMGGTP